MQSEIKLSIVSPVYRAEKIVPTLVKRIEESVKTITSNYEIILVEDCGPDNSWEVIEEITKTNKHVIGIKLSRNFGQHYAITAGLDHASGDWVVVMDCDLQDQPEEISKLYAEAQKGFDVVLAVRHERKDTFFKKAFSFLFYKTLSYLSGVKQDSGVANFGIYSRKVIDSIALMREPIRYFPTMVNWVGFKKSKVEVNHDARFEGETSYSFKKLLELALNIILAYSDKPLRLIIKIGFIVSLISVIVGIYYIVLWCMGSIEVLGFTSLIISLYFLSGIVISILGIIGLIGVDETCQGEGIGKQLMNKVREFLAENEVQELEVATQLNNEQACSFYRKCQLSKKSITNIYHFWLK